MNTSNHLNRPTPILRQLQDSRETRRAMLHGLNRMRRELEFHHCPKNRKGELKVELDAIIAAMDALKQPERVAAVAEQKALEREMATWERLTLEEELELVK